jgi:alkylation response protein AidB-like acyl-CoA dehydrogenase
MSTRNQLEDLIALLQERDLLDDPLVAQRIAKFRIGAEALRLGAMRALTAQMKNGIPGPEGSVLKLQWSALNQEMTDFACEMLGAEGLEAGKEWTYRMLRSRANSIEGGTTEILKNIVAERVLGLPRLR